MGAVDAWMEVLTLIEDCKLDDKHYCGGAADIAKFFDQIRRDLVYRMARAGGMPEPVITAYTSYLENLMVYNCLAGGVGSAFRRSCGIPQGCPFSMVIVAMIMRPWILMMRTFTGIKCYILADDVLIVATGKHMAANFAKALNATRLYLHKMGAKVAPTKSYNFASHPKARRWISKVKWDNIAESIEVVTDFRYLGAHITTTNSTTSTTMDDRVAKP